MHFWHLIAFFSLIWWGCWQLILLLWTPTVITLDTFFVSFSSLLGLLFHKVGLFCCISVWCRAGSVQQIFRLKQKKKKRLREQKLNGRILINLEAYHYNLALSQSNVELKNQHYGNVLIFFWHQNMFVSFLVHWDFPIMSVLQAY